MYYLAYGSNMNHKWMFQLCPSARIVGKSELVGYQLIFAGENDSVYATVIKVDDNKSVVPVVVWEVSTSDEIALDNYEDYPNLYRKEWINMTINHQRYEAMLYVMNSTTFGVPHQDYYMMIEEAYQTNQFDITILQKALAQSINNKGDDNGIL